MSESNPTPEDPRTGRRLRLAALLVAFTLAGGALLRAGALPRPGPGPDPGELARHFEAAPSGPVAFRGELDRTHVMPSSDGLVRVELVMAAEERAARLRVPTDLVVVLDRSGSMRGEKLAHARAAIRALVDELAPEDRFGLVTYAHGAERRVGMESPAGGARARWLAAVDAIQARGGTHLSGGLDLGLSLLGGAKTAGREPRLILISDGLANQGDTSRAGLRARATRASTQEWVLSTVGVGVDFDGELMASLADAGAGNFHFLESAVDLAEVFSAEFETARETVASALDVALTPAPGVEVVDAAGYPLHREGGAIHFRPGSLFAGQERRVWVTLRVTNADPGIQELGGFALSYRADGDRQSAAFRDAPRVARVADPEAYYAGVDVDAWERSVTVDELNALRREVANEVAAGRAPAALQRVEELQAGLASQNERLRSKKVEEALSEVGKLHSQVEDHVEGDREIAPAQLQQLRSLGYVTGRPGSRK